MENLENIDIHACPLRDLVKQYFEKKYPIMSDGIALCGESGQKWVFDLVVNAENEGGSFGIFVRDWDRSIGVNQLRRLEKACRDTEMAGGIIFGNTFSPHAKKFAKNYGISVFTRWDLVHKMGIW
ncbi:MAG TPA: restriction endonuclease [Candidatus Lokiarchaeia archaeon]|nr:restriction endonuclease [Candidatus Lokiarchaeia archaeon]